MKEILPNIYQATTTIKSGSLKVPATSAMVIIKQEAQVILIDPFALPESETKVLESIRVPNVHSPHWTMTR